MAFRPCFHDLYFFSQIYVFRVYFILARYTAQKQALKKTCLTRVDKVTRKGITFVSFSSFLEFQLVQSIINLSFWLFIFTSPSVKKANTREILWKSVE